MRWGWLIILSLSAPLGTAHAGAIGDGLDCNLNGFSFGCDWKPSGCYKPHPPYAFVNDVDSYNEAVEEYNLYLSSVDSYLRCIIGEAKSDIEKNFPNQVKKSVDKLTDDVSRDADRAKSDLELARSSIRRR